MHHTSAVGDGVAAANHHELHLRALHSGRNEFFGAPVDVDSGALKDPQRRVNGESEFSPNRALALCGTRPIAVWTPRQFTTKGHVAHDIPCSAVLAGVLVGDAGVDGHTKVGARNPVALYRPPHSLDPRPRLEFGSSQKVLVAVVDQGLGAAHRPPCVRRQGVEVVGEVDVGPQPAKDKPQPNLVLEVEQRTTVEATGHALGFVGALEWGRIGVGSADHNDSVPALRPKRRSAVHTLVAMQVVDDAQYYAWAHGAKVAQPSFERTLRV